MKRVGATVSAREELLTELLNEVPGYVPELAPLMGPSALAITQVFARYLQVLRDALRGARDTGLPRFLDAYGAAPLPAQSAAVPIVFSMLPNSPVDVDVPQGTQVAATSASGDVIFATTTSLSVCRANLVALYCTDPIADTYADYTLALPSGFTLFGNTTQAEHILYLGHDRLFALQGTSSIILSFGVSEADRDALELNIAWEYLAADGWRPFDDPSLQRLVADGQIVLSREHGPPGNQADVNDVTSYWIRGRLLDPLPSQGAGSLAVLPTLREIAVSAQFDTGGIAPDAAFLDVIPLETGNGFRPFGTAPAQFMTFYLSSSQVFSQKGGNIHIDVLVTNPGVGSMTSSGLAWEYFSGTQNQWMALSVSDSTNGFTTWASGTQPITFTCPQDWSPTMVNGQSNLWLRARITVAKPYGSPVTYTITYPNGVPTITPSPGFSPPLLGGLTLGYRYATDPVPPDHILAYNDFEYVDYTAANASPRQRITPFAALSDVDPAVYLAFDQKLPSGLVSLFFAAPAVAAGESVGPSSFAWEYLTANGWTDLGANDETQGFQQTGIIQFGGPWDAIASDGPGGSLYRVRARLKSGGSGPPLVSLGLWLNATWGLNEQAFSEDPLGSSDGTPGQSVSVAQGRSPVLEGEVLEVSEWTGSGVGWELAVEGVPASDLRFDRDTSGNVTAAWVRWHSQPDVFGSGPTDRHYTIERSTGLFRFGDGVHGMIPPGAAQIVATYSAGGGVSGNIAANTIRQLRAALPFVQSATNPLAASGGADTETLVALRERAPEVFRHQGRAVSATDFEWLAREATPAVARSRCRTACGPEGQTQPGWVTVIIVPYGDEAQPAPDAETLLLVRQYLAARAPATVADRLQVVAPTYQPITVVADIVPEPNQDPTAVEASVRAALDQFLHPTEGGSSGSGWAFGQSVYLSQIATLVESISGVDYASQIELQVLGSVFGDVVTCGPDVLVCSGDHELRLLLGGTC
jgi:hypothetical protein